MRNSTAVSAGVPAPYPDLRALTEYLRLLRLVVDDPSPQNTDNYVAFDRDEFTPVANTSIGLRPGEYSSCILYDGVELQARLAQAGDKALRNTARGVLNHLAGCVASSGAFPHERVLHAYEQLDITAFLVVDGDTDKMAFARKRMRLELMNVWVQETQWRESPNTGERTEVLENVAIGWRFWGAPYGAAWIAKTAGRLRLRNYY